MYYLLSVVGGSVVVCITSIGLKTLSGPDATIENDPIFPSWYVVNTNIYVISDRRVDVNWNCPFPAVSSSFVTILYDG